MFACVEWRKLTRHCPLPALLVAGVTGATVYQLVYTLPRWGPLVAAPSAASGATARVVVPLLVVFAALFNLHMFAQTLVFKSDGAMGVGLVNAVRGAIITALAAAIFCSPVRPWLCITRQSGLSAVVTALGGVGWVVAGARAKRVQQAPAAPRRSARLRGAEKKEI